MSSVSHQTSVNHHADSLHATLPNLLKHDGPAGLVVFLVALPLCLGIALASGAPIFAGIIAGIVGGVVVSVLSGSQVSVSGPAAGLAAIVAVAIQDIGYQSFLIAVVLAGMMQLLLGMMRFGVIANYVPNSVIKGMLAGIGIVIILKQIPHALGRDNSYIGEFRFLEAGGNTTLSDIAAAVMSASTGAVIIAGVSLALLVAWNEFSSKSRFLQWLPGPLVAVAFGIILNQAFASWAPSLQLKEAEHLVNLPVAGDAGEFFRQFTLPNFSSITNARVWKAAGTIAAVASLESLLSLEAADRLDPFKRISPPNRELRAQGIGNVVSGLIGGLPITTVAVRTSANVYAGARTWMSAFIHGVLLLAAVLLIPDLLKLTPLASLAAILIVVGFKLTKVSLYRTMYALGWDQFVPFIITVVAVVFSDLLTGVLIGIACGAFFVIRTNHHEAITVVSQGSNYIMRFNKDASFVNKNEFRDKLGKIPDGSHVLIDGTRALFIDRDILEAVVDFQELAPYREIQIELKRWDSRKL